MSPRHPRHRDVIERTRRDLARYERREPGARFFRSLALIGSVGWPIVVFATGGALLGRVLDARFRTGLSLTLSLLGAGTALGCFVAYRTLRGGGP
jgi:hypothetical protein